MTLEDVANLLLLPILGDMNPNDIELSTKEEAVEAKLRKGMTENAKLSHRVRAFSKASTAICIAAFVAVDTQFCTYDLIKEDDWNDHPCTPKIMIALHALIHSLHIIKMILRF